MFCSGLCSAHIHCNPPAYHPARPQTLATKRGLEIQQGDIYTLSGVTTGGSGSVDTAYFQPSSLSPTFVPGFFNINFSNFLAILLDIFFSLTPPPTSVVSPLSSSSALLQPYVVIATIFGSSIPWTVCCLASSDPVCRCRLRRTPLLCRLRRLSPPSPLPLSPPSPVASFASTAVASIACRLLRLCRHLVGSSVFWTVCCKFQHKVPCVRPRFCASFVSSCRRLMNCLS